ncbi:hypothetical protein [Aureibaculum conchae]|uniref:hypothetical protein n=1 Tax=Aureibaculum sp. 2308TA14-22 TaxID=3108392 RepID=UPI0033998CFF
MVSNTNNSKNGCEILIQAAVPEIYRVNAFRISGLNVNSSTREITSQLRKNQMFEKYGDVSVKNDSPFPIVPSPDNDQIRLALHRLRDPETRLIDEFFWFWPHSFDSANTDKALEFLSKNDIKSAENIWIKEEATLTESNVSKHNLAILSHLQALDYELNGQGITNSKLEEYWENAFKRWKVLFDHEGFWSRLTARVREMDDPRLTTGFIKRLRESLPSAILQINVKIALNAAEKGDIAKANRHIQFVNESGFGSDVGLRAINKVIEPVRNRIKIICKRFNDVPYTNPQTELNAGKKIIEETKTALKILDILLPDKSPIREGAHDEIGLTALGFIIAYSNKTEDDLEDALKILEDIKSIVLGESAVSRVSQNYDIIKKNYDSKRIYNTCFFCKTNKPNGKSSIEQPMHGEIEKQLLYNSITWRHLTVKVPRCEQCKKEHQKEDTIITLGVIASIILGILFASLFSSFWVFVILATIGIVMSIRLGIKSNKTAGRSTFKQFPEIKELLARGWTWGASPPQN